MLFYKLCLEKTSVHVFKRFYLIAVIVISISIPFIVFTEYVKTEPTNLIIASDFDNKAAPNFTEGKFFLDYAPYIFWSILKCVIYDLYLNVSKKIKFTFTCSSGSCDRTNIIW